MKDVQATQNKMRMDMMSGAAADVAADAQRLADNFTKAMGVFKALKAQDAVDASKANVDAAAAIVKAAKAGDLEAAKAPAGTIQKSCKGCHDVHREALPDKTYKFK
jgi:cytochrome c556